LQCTRCAIERRRHHPTGGNPAVRRPFAHA
jgi:hypothetical protein